MVINTNVSQIKRHDHKNRSNKFFLSHHRRNEEKKDADYILLITSSFDPETALRVFPSVVRAR